MLSSIEVNDMDCGNGQAVVCCMIQLVSKIQTYLCLPIVTLDNMYNY